MSQLAIIVDFTTQPGQFDAFMDKMLEHARASRKEPGCLRFDVVIPKRSENRIMLYELYKDRAALDLHSNTDRIKAHMEATKDMLAERVLHICEVRDTGGA